MEEQEAVESTEELDATEESSPSEEIEETEESAESEQEEESGESSEEEEPGEETTETKPKKNRVQQRISDLVLEKKQAALEAKFYREQYENTQRQPVAPVKEVELEKVNPPGLPPDRYDFDDDKDYQAAIGKYQDSSINYQRQIIREEMQLANQGTQQQQAEQRQAEAQKEAQKRIKTVEESGPEKYQDFNEVAFIPQEVSGFVTQFEHAVDIAYHWGKNPEERAEITHLAKTNPTLCAAKIGALDAKFASGTKAITKTPKPVKTVKTRNKASSRPDATKDPKAYIAWRNEQESNG